MEIVVGPISNYSQAKYQGTLRAHYTLSARRQIYAYCHQLRHPSPGPICPVMSQTERGKESNHVAWEEGDFVLNIGDADAGDPPLAELVAVAVVYGVGLAGGDAVDCGI